MVARAASESPHKPVSHPPFFYCPDSPIPAPAFRIFPLRHWLCPLTFAIQANYDKTFMLPNRQISFYFFCQMPLVALLGQPAGIRVRPFGFVDGLSHRDVFKVQQDRAGFLWITTANGLNRFDGHTFIDWTAAYALPALPNDVYPDLVLDAIRNGYFIVVANTRTDEGSVHRPPHHRRLARAVNVTALFAVRRRSGSSGCARGLA